MVIIVKNGQLGGFEQEIVKNWWKNGKNSKKMLAKVMEGGIITNVEKTCSFLLYLGWSETVV